MSIPATPVSDEFDADLKPPSFAEATAVWLKIGLLSFGGPAGQIALMHRIVVDEKRWIGEERFLHALNYCMLLPGPEAQQLATYLGWLLHRTAGGVVAGVLFVLPGALLIMVLSAVYALYSDVPLLGAVFFGIKAAVLAIVVQALLRIARRALKNRAMIAIAVAAFLSIYVLDIPFPVIVLAAGLVGFLGSRAAPNLFRSGGHGSHGTANLRGAIDVMFERGELAHTAPSTTKLVHTCLIWLPLWLGPVALLWLMLPQTVWPQIAGFFSVMAVVTFGGAYAVLAYVAQAAVESYGWLSPGEMVDGLGLAETTPGPLILVLQFVGFLAAFRAPGAFDPLTAGILGGMLTVWVTFAPCFFWIFLGAPYMERLRGNQTLSAALTGITAAVVGVIANLALWFALHVVFGDVRELTILGVGPDIPVWGTIDWRAALLSLAAMVMIFRFNLGMITTLGLCAVAGIALMTIPL